MTTPQKEHGAPTAEEVGSLRDAAHAVRLAVRWRKPLLVMLGGFCGLVLSAAGYYVHHLSTLEGWEQVAAAQKAHAEEDKHWKEAHDVRLRKVESQDGVLQLVVDTLRTVQQELVALNSTVARLDGYFRALPRYREGREDDDTDRARDHRAARPRAPPSARP